MELLVTGVIGWSLVHLFKAAAPGPRQRLDGALGVGPAKGLMAVLILAALVLIVLGWRSADPAGVYAPPPWGRSLTLLLMAVAVVLFAAAGPPTNIKRVIRHPQLTGILVFAVGHLLANGDSRSLVLFGGLALWAILEIGFINRRDGAREPPAASPVSVDVRVVVSGLVVYALLIWLHPWIAGVRLLPGAS
jgi:uncharacterized membrane protein